MSAYNFWNPDCSSSSFIYTIASEKDTIYNLLTWMDGQTDRYVPTSRINVRINVNKTKIATFIIIIIKTFLVLV